MATGGRREVALWLALGGGAGMVAAVVVFVARPAGDIAVPPGVAPVAAALVPREPAGALTCSLIPERSRVVSSSTAPVTIAWSAGGCANGREPFAEAGTRWERLEVPDDEQTVTQRSYDPATRTYAATRWFLDAEAMAVARRRRDPAPSPAAGACGVDPAATARRAGAAAAIKAGLPPLPNEKLVYGCVAAR